MFSNKTKLHFWINSLIMVKKYLIIRTFLFIAFAVVNFNFLILTIIILNILLRDNILLTKKYHTKILSIYDNIYEKNVYDNEEEINKLLSIKAYFLFKYPFHKYCEEAYLYLKYFLFISYFMIKDYEKAYAVVDEIDNFVEKYVIDANKKVKEKNEKIKDENDKRKRWKRKKMVDYIPEIDYPRDYAKEKINGKGLLSYLENEDDEYAIKLKELFLQKKKYYERENKTVLAC